ncbi:MAG: M67 family metallopeptidase [Sphingomonadales bacterium]|nr:M67 family metallopeptidase [Sphingomonadaceae bacterium]MBS3930960.1 M67 family metallopeptidase [Sphingomonadales bacterium]
MDLEVTSGATATLLKEATQAHPRECCGLLLGEHGVVREARPCANVHPQPERHFEIDPAALIAAHRAARSGALQVLGYYHSHPNGRAEPSAEDRAQASGDGRVWAIVAGGEVSWWRDTPQCFEPLPTRLAAG